MKKRCRLFLIHFSETTGPIGTKLDRDVHLTVLRKKYFVCLAVHKKNERPKSVKKGVVCFCMWAIYFQPILKFFLCDPYKSLFICSFFYNCYQDIRASKWVQHPKFRIFISCLILIVLFSFDSLWHFLPSFFNQIWTSSCGFRDKRGYMVPKGTNSQNDNVFYFMLDLYAVFLLNSFENFLFWI